MNPVIEVIRMETGLEGTFGILRIQKQIFGATLEPPDRQNSPNISSIPTGQYICQRVDSARFGDTFEVKNVFGRTLIRFHPGNWVADTEGCILIGSVVDKLRDKKGGQSRTLVNSGSTFKKLLAMLTNYEWFHLTISEHY